MKVFAVAPMSRNGITADKRYQVYDDDGHGFKIRNDSEEELFCLWEGCAHLRGKSWTRIEEAEHITLQPGDYVSTAGMTEDQYHKVAAAFMAAGADENEYPKIEWFRDEGLPMFGWYDGCGLYHGEALSDYGRHLTLEQVLGAGDTPEEPVTDTTIAALRLARARLQEAQGAYQLALDAVRAELGEGFVLVEAGEESAEDMSDPANWREGDVLVARENACDLTEGKKYIVKRVISDSDIELVEDDADEGAIRVPERFKWHSRPN